MSDDGEPRERFWQIICSFQHFWGTLIVLNVVFAVLLVVPLLFFGSTQSRGSFTISLIVGGIIFVTLTSLLLVFRKCNKRQQGF